MTGVQTCALPISPAALAYGAIRTARGAIDRQGGFGQVSNMLHAPVSRSTKSDIRAIAIQTGQGNKDIISAYYDALSSQFSEEAGKRIVESGGDRKSVV